jgi:hypothetical protein
MKRKHLFSIIGQSIIIVILFAYAMAQRVRAQAAEQDALAQHELAYQAQNEAEMQRKAAEESAKIAFRSAEEARRQAEKCK